MNNQQHLSWKLSMNGNSIHKFDVPVPCAFGISSFEALRRGKRKSKRKVSASFQAVIYKGY